MGRLFWVEFAEAHEIDYYMCKGCRAHIALEESHDSNYSIYLLFIIDQIKRGYILVNPVGVSDYGSSAMGEAIVRIQACDSPEPDLIGGLFSKVVNVQMDRAIHNRQVGNHIVSDIHCVKCCDNLGYQYVTPDQETKVQKDMVQLIMKKLLLKKGDDILDAETMIPIREENADNVEESVLPIATDNTGPSTSADRAPDADYIPSALVQHMFQTVIWGQERMERSINRLQERFDFEFPTPPPS